MPPRKKSRKSPRKLVGRRNKNGPRSPQTILAQARRNNLERALERGGDFFTGLADTSGGAGSGSSRASPIIPSKSRRQARKYSKFVVLPTSPEPFEQNCLEREPLPAGYVFVPKGDVYITRHCRSETKDSQQMVYVVYNKAGKRTLGIRVPSDIYTSVLQDAAATADSRANAVQHRDAKELSRSRQLLRAQFPLMPAESLEVILDHAFLKGSGRVGRTSTKTDERKVILAVEAHIRHTCTPYEQLLQTGMDRTKAREAVWGTVKAIKTAWEGGESQHMGLLTLRSR